MIDGIAIESVRVEADEAGFMLVVGLDAQLCERFADACAYDFQFRLPQDVALALLEQARSVIGPWAAEGERERLAYERASDEEREAVLYGADADETEDYLAAADLERKRQKESPDHERD